MIERTKTLSVTSGKGGVGKTTIVSNLALALAASGEQVLIFDGDVGMANVEIFFGVRPEGSLADVLAGRKTISEVLVDLAPGVRLLSGGSGLSELTSMNNFQRRALMEAVSELPYQFSTMIVDTAPGLGENVLYLNSAADEVLIILTPEPASFADSYALLKVLNQRHRVKNFTILTNEVQDSNEGLILFRRFNDVVSRFLDVGLDYAGSVPADPALRKANHLQRLILRQDPRAVSSVAIRAIANRWVRISHATHGNAIKGGLQPFWRSVVGVA